MTLAKLLLEQETLTLLPANFFSLNDSEYFPSVTSENSMMSANDYLHITFVV
jgi:hypothetical protein